MVNELRSLPEIDSSWVKTYSVERNGHTETFAVLETSPDQARGTIVCVHGNPTWSYMWRHFLGELGSEWRVIALDQLGMGFSSRSPAMRSLATRIDDLDALLSAAHVEGPVTLIAHDWGGPVALGWATKHSDRVERLVLFNTGTQIPTTGVPGLITVSRTAVLRRMICTQTKAFITGALVTTGGISRQIRRAYYSPYRTPTRRRAIAQFVEDIPTDDAHQSAQELRDLAEKSHDLDVPTLLVWGVRDFVFHTGVLADMQQTFPHADTITLDTGHLSPEHPDAPQLIRQWLDTARNDSVSEKNVAAPSDQMLDLNEAIRRRAVTTPEDMAVFNANNKTHTTWSELSLLISRCRENLVQRGAKPGSRVAILTPFDANTIACIYACWAEGIVPVVADPGLGISNMRRALRESRPQFVLTSRATRVVARFLHLAYRAQRVDIKKIIQGRGGRHDVVLMSDDALAAVLYTSGATGPAKGVQYTHGQLRALAHAIQQQFSIRDDDGIAAAYLPFALYGPAWGVAVGLPKINVLAPGKLTAQHLRDALDGVNGKVLFAAPAPLRNVIKDGEVFADVRCVMSAGAPVGDALLRDVQRSFPNAQLFSPYGMTEMLIVTDGVRNSEVVSYGVPVGQPLPNVEVMILPIGVTGADVVRPHGEGDTGEVFVRGPWLSKGYDQHWKRNRDARIFYNGYEWHRTGDVGHIKSGLFIEGRVAHVISHNGEVVTPVPIEQSIEEVFPGVTAAVVGATVGQQPQIVVVFCDGATSGKADAKTAALVRDVVPGVHTVLYKRELPVDRRHNSKIDRLALGEWATREIKKK